MAAYLDDFEAARQAASSAGDLLARIKRKFPDWAQERPLATSERQPSRRRSEGRCGEGTTPRILPGKFEGGLKQWCMRI